jgi:putative ATP-dependent endonuclease of OLD family
VNAVTAALLCIEEPEVYLHPHARRVISERLNDFIGDRNQVVLTTHSMEFLKSDGAELNVIVARHDRQHGTTSVSVDLKEYAAILIYSTANEVFFADKVIVCEGFDDFIVRATARELFPKQLDANNVSVISVGGKDNISKMVKLVRKLGIECYIMADFDYLLRDAGEERKRYDASPHQSILSLGVDFFSQSCTFGSDGRQMLTRLQRLRAVIKRDEEAAFYTAKAAGEIENQEIGGLLEELRTHGVGLLSGQVEDLCTDDTFSRDRKLSLDRIFELNQRLVNAQEITDIFNTEEIAALLRHVLAAPRD